MAENKKQRKPPFRKYSPTGLNPMKPTAGKGNHPDVSHRTAYQATEYNIAKEIYRLMLEEGLSQKEIAARLNCSVPMVKKYINIELKDAQDGLIDVRGKFAVLAYQRLEKYGISPSIKRIEESLAKGDYDPRAIETLLKTIKLQAELLAPKSTVNIENYNGGVIMTSGGDMYTEVVEMMRADEEYEPAFAINADDIELADYRIPKADE